MYCATNKDGELLYADYTGYHTNEELEKAFYCFSEYGSIDDEALTIEDVKAHLEDLKTEERNGGFDKGEFTHYMNVYDFIREEFEIITILVPVEDSIKIMELITVICKRNGWKTEYDFTDFEMRDELIKEFGKNAPKWLINDEICHTLTEMIEDYFNPDYGRYQELY